MIRVKDKEFGYRFSETSIILYPITQFFIEKIEKTLDIILKTTRNLGIFSEGHVLSAVRPGKRYLFEYFLSFDLKVWINIISALIIFSLIMSLTQRSFKTIFLNFWLFSSILLSETFPKIRLTKNLTQRIIICFWLLFSTVMLSAFSGVLYGFFVKNIPNDVIDSWNELYSRKEFRITISDLSSHSEFSEEDNILHDFKTRIDDKLIFDSNYNENKLFSLFENITKTNRVYIGQKDTLHTSLSKFGQTFENSLHISEYGGGISPYALIINPLIDSQLKRDINKL